MVDRRLLTDVRMLARRYSIFITDGYSLSGVHAVNGEHPLGLALDIVPDKAAGGRWSDIDRLARWAEPRQDRPRKPFRWVGYDGDAGHGRGHHCICPGATRRPTRRAARTVYTMRCPGTAPIAEPPPPPAGGTAAGSAASAAASVRHGGGGRNGEDRNGGRGGGSGSDSGGIGAKPKFAPAVPESGGVSSRG